MKYFLTLLTALLLLSLAAHAQTPPAKVPAAAPVPRQDAGPQQAAIAADPAREAFRQRRRQAAQRQRRLIFNNDGDDAITVPKSQPATAESMLSLRTTPLVGSQVDSIFYCSLYGPTSLHRTKVVRVHNAAAAGGMHKPVIGHAPHPEKWRPLPAR